MGFSGIGIWEILLIIVVVLIVLGPGKVPEIARKLGQAVRAIRRASTDLTTAISKEVDIDTSSKPPPTTNPDHKETKSTPYPGTVGNRKKESADPG